MILKAERTLVSIRNRENANIDTSFFQTIVSFPIKGTSELWAVMLQGYMYCILFMLPQLHLRLND